MDHALGRRDDGVGVAGDDVVFGALAARPELSDEQCAMVVRLTAGGHGVDVVIAAAGTGKTFALEAARAAWQHQGHHVIGAALAARAAAELEATAGVRSHTIASLLADLDRAEHRGLLPGTVLVIDEAGMVGTRTLGRLLDHAEHARAKVVLVGDPRQLPEIEAGGLLRGLGQRLEPIRLTHNRRQHEAWERAALAAFRAGDVDSALAAYDSHQRIVTCATAPATREAMVADWWAANLRGDRVLMVAARWADVDDLNARARQRVAAAGMLSGSVLEIDGRPYQVGDRVMTLRNQRRLGVRNGTVATITDIDQAEQVVTIHAEGATVHALPSEYLDAGYLRHAYATTIHKAQGLTVDQALVLGNDALDQEAGYVALSRGRANNRLYLVECPDEPEQHGVVTESAPLHALAASLRGSHAQRLAMDQGSNSPMPEPSLVHRYRELERLRRIDRATPRDPKADVDALQRSRVVLREALEEQRAQLATALSHRPLRHRREHDAERLVTVQRVNRLENRLEDTERALADALDAAGRLRLHRAKHGTELERLGAVGREIRDRLVSLVAGYRDRPPAYLASLGPWPARAIDQARWTEAATAVEDYRRREGITDPHRPLGALDRSNWQQRDALRNLEDVRRDLGLERRDQSRGIEIEL